MDQFEEKKVLTDLPEDIRKYSRRKLYIRIGILLAVYLFEAILLMLFWDKFISVDINYKIINSVAMLLIPPLLIIRPLKDEASWVGKIHECKVGTKTMFEVPGVMYTGGGILGRRFYHHTENRIVLKLVNGDEVFTKDISKFEVQRGAQVGRYPKGGTAVHIFGTKYTTVLPENEEDKVICVICGHENNGSDDQCGNCSHSLLKKSNIK